MTTLEEWLRKACELLQLQADFQFAVTTADGQSILAIARIQHIGAPQGMLIFQNYEQIRPYVDSGSRWLWLFRA